jgi:hypothetical protein
VPRAPKPEPEAYVLPRMPDKQMLRCKFGWSTESTKAFRSETFDWVELSGGPEQPFELPTLGLKAATIRRLTLATRAVLSGIEQFQQVTDLDITSLPRNGIDLSVFHHLRSAFCEDWSPQITKQLASLNGLNELAAMGFPEHDCSTWRELNVRSVAFTQGRLRTLQGLRHRGSLDSLYLAYLRGFSDLESVAAEKQLRSLFITNMPKLSGVLQLDSENLENVYVVSTPLSIGLGGLSRMERLVKLWLAVPSQKLDWHGLLSRPRLSMAAVLLPLDAPSDEELRAIASEYGQTLTAIRRVGPKARKQIQLELLRA